MPKWPDSVVSVEISNGEIEAILRKHPFFIKTGGAKILCLEDGRALIVSIGITDASKSPIASRTIAESKARAALVSQVNGVKVFTERDLSMKPLRRFRSTVNRPLSSVNRPSASVLHPQEKSKDLASLELGS